jgi:hypothetical protein
VCYRLNILKQAAYSTSLFILAGSRKVKFELVFAICAWRLDNHGGMGTHHGVWKFAVGNWRVAMSDEIHALQG